jgi:histidinol-phosphatase (PHP family)
MLMCIASGRGTAGRILRRPARWSASVNARCRSELPALVFTEHLDLEDAWRVEDGDIGEHAQKYVDGSGHVRLPPFDVDGYLEAVDRRRHEYPELRILTGVEFGQPHLWDARAAALLSSGAINRVNGSLHTLPFDDDDRSEPTTLFRHMPADEVMWAYLEEIPRVVNGSDSFEVFSHIDYAVRSWPVAVAGPFDPRRFEEGFRMAMRAIADSERVLEMNTRRLWSWIPQWWAEEGGAAVSFGSDAHGPDAVAANFPEATAMVEYFGFRPGSGPEDFWAR